MAVAHKGHVRRDDSPAFDSREYYTINIPNTANTELSAGFSQNTEGALTMMQYNTSSSENWQLFFQSGHYFIRNFDYGPMFQLGVTEDSKLWPKLYGRSGSLGQQWTLNKVDGGWEMGNELWGPGFRYALPHDWPMPAIRSEPEGSVWNITINRSAALAKPITGSWLSKVDNVEVRSSASSAASSATAASSMTGATNSVNPTGSPPASGFVSGSPLSTPSSSATSGAPATSSSSLSLSSGAIAGIVIGAVALIGAIVFALWFFLVKRRNARKRSSHPYEMHNDGAEKYAHRAELAAPPAELATREKDNPAFRAEM